MISTPFVKVRQWRESVKLRRFQQKPGNTRGEKHPLYHPRELEFSTPFLYALSGYITRTYDFVRLPHHHRRSPRFTSPHRCPSLAQTRALSTTIRRRRHSRCRVSDTCVSGYFVCARVYRQPGPHAYHHMNVSWCVYTINLSILTLRPIPPLPIPVI